VNIKDETSFLNFVTNFNGTIAGDVSPEMARWMLTLNTNNRKIQKNTVIKFVEIIKNNRWVNTGEPVIISQEGVLNDGQHRLMAIVEADQSVPLDIRFGIKREAMTATNTGMKRSGKDILFLRGEKNASALAATIRLLSLWEDGKITYYTHVIDSLLLQETLNKNPDARIAVDMMASQPMPTKQSWFSFCLCVFIKYWEIEKVYAFSKRVGSGEGYDNDPTRALHKRIATLHYQKHQKVATIDKIIYTFKSWNAYIEGRKITQLKVNEQDRHIDTFPKLTKVGRK
jgi:hypothetical protein